MGTESFIGQEVSHRRGWRAGMLVGAAGAAALMGTAGAAKWAVSSNLAGLQGKEERIDIAPSFAACSKAGENCVSTGCCQVSGHTCFTKKGSMAQCNGARLASKASPVASWLIIRCLWK